MDGSISESKAYIACSRKVYIHTANAIKQLADDKSCTVDENQVDAAPRVQCRTYGVHATDHTHRHGRRLNLTARDQERKIN